MNTTSNLKSWWRQFPKELRLLTQGRLSASIGAGGVLYLTPMVFSLSLSASEIIDGIAFAAIAGIITRFICGIYLDKGIGFTSLLKISALLAIVADLILFKTQQYQQFIFGELVLGAAAGVYWPSIEIAVPIICKEYKSSKGFAIVRTADALGVFIGTLIGSTATYLGYIRSIYIIDILFLFIFVRIISTKMLESEARDLGNTFKSNNKLKVEKKLFIQDLYTLIPNLAPILIIGFFATGMLALQQSALPIDLELGGIYRPAIPKSSAGFLMACQLALLPIIQWPIGNWLAKKNVRYGLTISIISFVAGNLCFFISSFYVNGIIFTFSGMVLVSIGLASFLPTATEAVIQVTSEKKRGISMGIYSQCFGLSHIALPWLSARIISYAEGVYLFWAINSLAFLFILPLTNLIRKTGQK